MNAKPSGRAVRRINSFRESGTASRGLGKAISRPRASQPRIQIGSEVFLDKVQKDLDLRDQTRALGVQSTRHDRSWLPSRQNGYKPLGDGGAGGTVKRKNNDTPAVQ